MTVDKLADQIASAVTQYAPAAYETAKTVERINYLDWLLTDLAYAGFGVSAFFIGRWIWSKGKATNLSHDRDEGLQTLGVFVWSVGAFTALFASFSLLASPWIFVGLSNPGLALAHDAIKKILGT